MNWILAAFVVLLVLVAVLRLVRWWRTRRQQGKAAPPLHEVVPEGIEPQPRMLFYFYSEHCGACRQVTPLIEALGREREGVVKVDVRRHIGTARRFGIMGTPSMVLVDRGQIARVHVGAISGGELQQFYTGQKN